MFKKVFITLIMLILSVNILAIPKPEIEITELSKNIILEEAYGYVFKDSLELEDISDREIKEKLETEKNNFLSTNKKDTKPFNSSKYIKNSLISVKNKDFNTNWDHMFVGTDSEGNISVLKAFKTSSSILSCRNEAKNISKSLEKKYGNQNITSYSTKKPYYNLRNLKNGTIEIECLLNKKNYSYISLSISYTIY